MPLRKYTRQIGLTFTGGPYTVHVRDSEGRFLREDTVADLEDIAPYCYQVGAASQLSVGSTFTIVADGRVIGVATLEW